jgi:hypothetical protein
MSVIIFQEAISSPLQDLLPNVGIMALWMTVMPYSLLFLTGNFVRFPSIERVSKAKQLQLMTGVLPLAYWFTCFVCDFLFYVTVAGIMVLGVFVADQLNVFNGSEELGMYICVCVCVCACVCAYMRVYVNMHV